MSLLAPLLATATAFLFFFCIFRPLEWAFPAKEQKFFRPDWMTDFFFFLGQNLVWVALIYWGLGHVEGWIDGVMPEGFRAAVAAQPWEVQTAEVIVLSDFLIYWGHRLQHRVEFLWRFHAIHHTSEHLDWLAANREHPLDALFTIAVINLPAIILGFPLHTIAAFIAFRGLWAIYIHSNIRLPLGHLGLLIGSPELHRWHHDRDRDAGNYANLCPLMDKIFGTHVYPGHDPERFGINEPVADDYIGHLLQPFKSRKKPAFTRENIPSIMARSQDVTP